MKLFRCSDARRRQRSFARNNRRLRPAQAPSRVVEIVNSEVNTADRKRLSFAFDFVASDFFSPAWRNWQTRWTQNPVAARPCGFEPLRRQSSSLSVGRSILDVGGSMFAGVTSIVWVRFPPPAVFIEHWAFRILHVRPSMTRSFS